MVGAAASVPRPSSNRFASVGGSTQNLRVTTDTFGGEGQDRAVHVAHQGTCGHFQGVRIPSRVPMRTTSTAPRRPAQQSSTRSPSFTSPSSGANRSASSSRASSQRSGRCWGKTAAAPRWRTSRGELGEVRAVHHPSRRLRVRHPVPSADGVSGTAVPLASHGRVSAQASHGARAPFHTGERSPAHAPQRAARG